ncbi:DUF362 domain-containing protein [Oscillospiraceae bacterium MB08-C2-2]|nr:DUF362 domain-containing protein [Oscillospiraceae bacterium MB08-C2-2]
MADIYIGYGSNMQEITRQLMEEANVYSQIEPSMKIGIKPNLVVAKEASGGATTHPEIVEGIIQYLQGKGHKNITILEGSWVGDRTKRAFEVCGYNQLAKQYGVKIVDTQQDTSRKVKAGKMELAICQSALEMDYLINVPVLKAHCQTDMTCCLKNMKGCIPDSEKRRYHTMGLHGPIAALATVLKPSLHIIDGICGDLTFEEGGNPVAAGRILLGFDGVLMDSYCAGLLGYHPDEIGYLQKAHQAGAGAYADSSTQVLELNPEERPVGLPQASNIARRLAKHIEEDSACSACYAALIFALNRVGDRGLAPGEKIKIGQGFRGKTAEGLGVGNCTRGCTQFVKGCPPSAVDIAEALQRR